MTRNKTENNLKLPLVVFTGVNLVEGGPLSILKDAIDAFIKHYLKDYRLIIFVNDLQLFREYSNEKITFIERSQIKTSYFKRLWFEYVECYFLSKKLQPFLWFSLHDISPNIISTKKAVYCHNPGPFYRASFKEAVMEPTFFLFSKFYKFLYQINIRSNDYVVVQQDWLRKFFIEKFRLKNVIVAHPNISIRIVKSTISNKTAGIYTFFYPAFPRVFKNFETLLEAVKILLKKRSDFEVLITMKGTENKYARSIYKRFGAVNQIKFIGIQPREEILKLYEQIDCLVFPSKLETWGLPISEAKLFGKPMLVADQKYAKETAGNYEKVCFFKTEDFTSLSSSMNSIIDGFINFENKPYEKPPQPYFNNWKDLIQMLLSS